MSELSNCKCHYSSVVISNLIRICSFILRHPLYFSCSVFFLPYLLKLISFLSPIILTTFLASLPFLAGFVHTASSKLEFASILERLQFKKDSPNEELNRSEDLRMYEIVFGPSSMAAVMRENDDVDPSEFPDQAPQIRKPGVGKPEEDLGGNKILPEPEGSCVVMEEKRLENFIKILDEFERMASNVEGIKKKLEPSKGAKSDKVVEKQNPLLMNGSEAPCNNNNHKTNDVAKLEDCSSMAKSQSQRLISSTADGDDEKFKVRAESCRVLDSKNDQGSMRREREWERTLACKLLEERKDVGGGEGMDSLWEAYEVEDSRGRRRREKIVEEEDDEEEEEVGGELCCLQALKLSAGKMNLGVGKFNLVRISKAIKGVGWLHKTTKNSKKVHNHGDHRY